MSLLEELQLAGLLLAAASILWAGALVLARGLRSAADRAADRDRKTALAFLASWVFGGETGAALPDALRRQPGLIAEAILEFLSLVRGEDLQRVIRDLETMTVADLLRRHAARGRPAVRLSCIEALGAFPGAATEAVLSITLKHPKSEVRLLSAQAMVDVGGPLTLEDLVELVSKGELGPSRRLDALVRRLTDADLAGTLRALEQTDLAVPMRILIIEVVGEVGNYAALPALIAAAADPEPTIRAASVEALGKLRHPASEGALARCLADPAWLVRARAVIAVRTSELSNLGPEIMSLMDDPFWIVRFEASQTLEQLQEVGVATLQSLAAKLRDASEVAGEGGVRAA